MTRPTPPRPPGPGRRAVVRAGIALPVGGVLLTACSTGTADDDPAPASTGAADSEGVVARTTDVPVGSATYDRDADVVLSQPTEGEFRAFDATCPHQGCAVSDMLDGELSCPCHGSRFDAATGEVLGGPATEGLTEIGVTVDGTDLVLDQRG